MNRFPQITLLHGKGDSPESSVKSLEVTLRSAHPMLQYARPLIPDNLDAKKAVEWFESFYLYRVPQGSLLVGIDRGGLIACAIQNALPGLRLSVVAINASTEEDGLIVEPSVPHSRLALYSSAYPPIKSRCDWGRYSEAYDVAWLADGCNNFYPLAYLISAWSRGADMAKEVSMMFPTA